MDRVCVPAPQVLEHELLNTKGTTTSRTLQATAENALDEATLTEVEVLPNLELSAKKK